MFSDKIFVPESAPIWHRLLNHLSCFFNNFGIIFSIDFGIDFCIVFGPIWNPKWLPNQASGGHLRPKGRKMCSHPYDCGHPFADPAPHDPPKQSKNTFGLIGVGCLPILDYFLMILKGFGRLCIHFDAILNHFGDLRAGFTLIQDDI